MCDAPFAAPSGATERPISSSSACRKTMAESLHSPLPLTKDQQLRAVFEYAGVGIAVTALDGRFVETNPRFCEILGYSAEELRSRTFLGVTYPDEVDATRTYMHDLLEGRIPGYKLEKRYVRADGRPVWCDVSVTALRRNDGTVSQFIGVIEDISERKAQAEELREMDRRKDEFLAILSHELRNPLAPIRQAAAITALPKASDDQRRWATEVIRRQVQTMALLLDDLLDVSRITRGTLQLRATQANLSEVINAAIETARPLIDAREHRFEVEVPHEPVLFQADTLRLAQVLSNLLTNAAKYTNSGGSIRLVAETDERQIVMRVEDDGIGIAPAALSRIFTMFSQAPEAQEHAEGGLGIGLALAKGLVELHGGTIEVRSAGPGCGSTFIVTLPHHRPTGAAAAPEEASPVPGPRKRRVLVADDNRDAADSLAMLLKMEGHDVRVVYDGAKAMEAIRENPPEIALLDIGMPEMSGYDVARTVRQTIPKERLTLIAVTGWGQKHDVTRALDAGFDCHFTKPIDPMSVAALLSATP
jgi:PAS domain S-box-containing protein